MDNVVFEGVEYIKASVIAKNFRYTADYVGQLCRGKKVDARLIGRTWFVNQESLLEHKKNKYSLTSPKIKRPVVLSEKVKSEKINVFPVLTTKTFRAFPATQTKILGNETRKLRISYELDDEFLIPKLIRKHYQPPTEIRVDQAEASKIVILGNKSVTNFTPTAIPEVALSGKLNVTDIKDISDEKEENLIKEKISVGEKKEDTKILSVGNKGFKHNKKTLKFYSKKSKSLPVQITTYNQPSLTVKAETQPVSVILKKPTLSNTNKLVENVKSLTKISNVDANKNDPNLLVIKSKPAPLLMRISPLIATFFASGVVFLILSASSTTVVNGESYNSIITFKLTQFFQAMEF